MEALDWRVPEEPREWVNAWGAFHDAKVVRIDSDRLHCSVTVQLELGFPREDYSKIPTVSVQISGVKFALAHAFRDWPGPVPVYRSDREAYEREIVEFQSRSRVETVSMTELVAFVKGDSDSSVMDGFYVSEPNAFRLRLSSVGKGDFDTWDLQIMGTSVVIQGSDPKITSISELLEAGNEAWDLWTERSEEIAQ